MARAGSAPLQHGQAGSPGGWRPAAPRGGPGKHEPRRAHGLPGLLWCSISRYVRLGLR